MIINIATRGWSPPTVTAQQKGVRVVRGKPFFYTKPEVIAARDEILYRIKSFMPNKPIEGNIKMDVAWCFYKKTAKETKYKGTRPDLDNLQKLLQDCMNGLLFKDDSQIVQLTTSKYESNNIEECGLQIFISEV